VIDDLETPVLRCTGSSAKGCKDFVFAAFFVVAMHWLFSKRLQGLCLCSLFCCLAC